MIDDEKLENLQRIIQEYKRQQEFIKFKFEELKIKEEVIFSGKNKLSSDLNYSYQKKINRR